MWMVCSIKLLKNVVNFVILGEEVEKMTEQDLPQKV